jgi:hypothetical protein
MRSVRAFSEARSCALPSAGISTSGGRCESFAASGVWSLWRRRMRGASVLGMGVALGAFVPEVDTNQLTVVS